MRRIDFKKKAVELPPDAPPCIVAGDVEKAVLGSLLRNPERLIHASESVPPEAFYGPVHRQIYEELLSFGMKQDTIDLVTFSQHLIDKGLMATIGGPGYLAELDNPTTPAIYAHYAGLLLQKLKMRQAWEQAEKIKRSVVSQAADFNEMSAEVLESLAAIRVAMEGESSQEKTMDDEIESWSEDWNLMATGKKESAMSLRWPCWNSEAGGLQPGYHIVSGTSSSGKSTLLGNIMVDACIKNNRPGLYVSYEMPVRMVLSRLVADLADVDGMHLFQPDRSYPSKEIKKAIGDALLVIRKSKLRIVHKPRMSSEGVCHLARKMFTDMGDCVLGVDYIQLIPKPTDIERGSNREREVAVNSAVLRTFSKEIDRPVIALSQLNQDGSTRESGSINMDSDSHMKVDREKDTKSGRVTEKGVWVYKSRNGASSFHLPLFLDGPKFRFEERIKK